MNKDKREELMVQCGEFLRDAGMTMKTKRGQAFAYAFWVGAMAATGHDPYIVVMLTSGRVSALVKEQP